MSENSSANANLDTDEEVEMLTPPSRTDLILHAPAPVKAKSRDRAAAMVPISDVKRSELQDRAAGFVKEVSLLDAHSKDYKKRVSDIATLGNAQIREAASSSNRMLDRPVAALSGGKDKGSATGKVSDGLVALRRQVEELDPAGANKTVARRLFGLLPGKLGDNVKDYFAKYQSAQANLNSILNSLREGQDGLMRDNGAIETESVNLWNNLEKLQEYAILADAISEAVDQEIAELRHTDPDRADALISDVQFVVKQKQQDLLTQMAVNVQGYMALNVVKKSNEELIRGAERASTTTVAALRVAIMTASALDNQKMVLDQISAVRDTTSQMIASNAARLKTQSGQVNEMSAGTSVDMDALKQAFADIYATMDAIDTFRAGAVESMKETVTVLRGELEGSTEYLERAQADDRALQSGVRKALEN